jgi:Flp pilus assembly protein TadD
MKKKSPHLRATYIRIVIICGVVGLLLISGAVGMLWKREHKKQQLQERDTHLAQARDEANKNDFPAAERDFIAALAIPGVPGTVWRELGLAYQQDHKRAEAITAYNRSLDSEPNDAFTLNILGNLYRDTHQYDLSEQDYQKALTLDGRLNIVALNLSHLYILEGHSDKAIAVLATKYDGTKRQSEIGVQLASLYRQYNHPDLAQQTLTQVLTVDPANPRAISMETPQ